MRKGLLCLLLTFLVVAGYTQTNADKEAVNGVVASFLKSWNTHNFTDLGTYTSSDFTYSNPLGRIWKGQEIVQRQLQTMHEGAFKNTPLTEESREVRMIAPDAAVVTLIAGMGAVTANGIKEEKQLRNLILAKQNGKWLLNTLQTTTINTTPQTASTTNSQ